MEYNLHEFNHMRVMSTMLSLDSRYRRAAKDMVDRFNGHGPAPHGFPGMTMPSLPAVPALPQSIGVVFKTKAGVNRASSLDMADRVCSAEARNSIFHSAMVDIGDVWVPPGVTAESVLSAMEQAEAATVHIENLAATYRQAVEDAVNLYKKQYGDVIVDIVKVMDRVVNHN